MSIEDNQNAINKLRQEAELYTALVRLKSNPDFKKLILQTYLIDECVKSVTKSVAENSDKYLELAKSTAHFSKWLESLELTLSSSYEEYGIYTRDPEHYFGDYTDDGRTLNVTAN